MMGMPLSPEMQAMVNEKVAERRAKVAASLGKTPEELGASEHEGHAHAHGAHEQSGGAEGEEVAPEPEVDEEAVLAFIRTRQETIDRLRAQVRSLEARCEHLEHQLALSEKKGDALRDALAKMRAELKAAKAAGVPSDGGAA